MKPEYQFVAEVNTAIFDFLKNKGLESKGRYLPPNSEQKSDGFSNRTCYDYLNILPNCAVLMLEAKMLDGDYVILKEYERKQNQMLQILWDVNVKVYYSYPEDLNFKIQGAPLLAASKVFPPQQVDGSSTQCKFCRRDTYENLEQLINRLLDSKDVAGETVYYLLEEDIRGRLGHPGTVMLLLLYNPLVKSIEVISGANIAKMVEAYEAAVKTPLSVEADITPDQRRALIAKIEKGIKAGQAVLDAIKIKAPHVRTSISHDYQKPSGYPRQSPGGFSR